MTDAVKKSIKVNMLGSFSFHDGEKILLEDEGKTRKLWNLLAYIIVNRGRKLSPTELPEILCSDDRIEDPVKAVKNLVYRLRVLLFNRPLPKLEYIKQNWGIYTWNTEIPIETDVDQIIAEYKDCLLYTSDAADEEDSVDLGGRRIIKKKKKKKKKK